MMTKQKTVRLGLAAFVALASINLAAPLSAGELKVGTKAPAWKLNGLDGKAVQSADFEGKVVVFNFWATWCPPCVREIPDFVEVQKEFKDKGVVFIGVSVDKPRSSGDKDDVESLLSPLLETKAKVESFVDKMKINYPIVWGDSKVDKDYGGITGIPQTYVVDKSGVIRASHLGMISKKDLLKSLKPLL